MAAPLPAAILAHPNTIHYWPMNDVGPGAVDVVGGEDLAENPTGAPPGVHGQPVQYQGGYAFLYEQTGPFIDGPTLTAPYFDGDQSGPNSYGLTLYRNGVTIGASTWTMFGWSYQDSSYPGRSIGGAIWSIYGGSTDQTSLYSFVGDLVYEANATGTPGSVTAAAALTSPQWFFWAVTMDTAGNIELYLNGVSVGTDTFVGFLTAPGYLRFGCQGTGASGPSNHWKGKTCQVAMFDVILTAEEIETFYESPGAVVPGPGVYLEPQLIG